MHNYIDADELVLRKGAIAAHDGERVLIPLNMRDGSVVAKGRGNVGKTQRNAWVSACGLLHHVCREAADGVGGKLQLVVSVLHVVSFQMQNILARPRNGARPMKEYIIIRANGAMPREKKLKLPALFVPSTEFVI